MPDATPSPVVEFDRVTVTYGKQHALRDVGATFMQGAAGLFGPNGAGKTTLLKTLLGLIRPNQGSMRVLDLDVTKHSLAIRARLGYMPESDAHIPGMNAVTFVAYCAQLAGLPRSDAMQRAHEVLYYVGLGEARYRNLDTYSTGMRQRIKLAQALVHDPDLLFLDEPTNGMDPRGRVEMLELIRDLAHNKGVNLLFNNGSILAEGDVHQIRDLIDEHPHKVYIKASEPRVVAREFLDVPHVISMNFEKDAVVVETNRPDEFYTRLTELAANGGVGTIQEVTSPDDNLEAVFRYLVKQ